MFLAAVVLPTPMLAARDSQLEALMQAIGSNSGLEVAFVEEKRIAILSAPLVTRGVLYFVPPETLLRVTHAPSWSRLLIDEGRIRFRDETGADIFDLSENTVAREFLANFLVLFAGDLESLQDRYKIAFEHRDSAWTLGLRPRRSPFDRFIDEVVLEGDASALTSMEMFDKDGDSTVTKFSRIETDQPLTRERLRSLFSE